MSEARYGYIGLGAMGSAMAAHLIATAPGRVTVFDIDDAAMGRALDLGASPASSAAEVAAASEIVSICVPAAEHVDAVLSGPGGIAEGAHDRLRVLVHSTVHPDTIQAARQTAAAWGIPLFDACVAGGVVQASDGTLIMLVGGLAAMDDDTRALVDIYGATVVDAGPPGAGAALKIAFNIMTYAQFAAAATAHDLLMDAGADPGAVFSAWQAAGQLGTLTDRYRTLLGISPEHMVGPFRDAMVTQVGIAQKGPDARPVARPDQGRDP
jgi:3-hydroxyisobutyrate dehydrogenase-like beta-hydroxyacid dehydrogenase